MHPVRSTAAPVSMPPRAPTVAPARASARRPFNRADPPSPAGRPTLGRGHPSRPADRPPDPILFQQFFKSVGPRTYAAQVKTAGNGNPYLVLTEGKRDDATGDVRKTRLFVFSEDFDAFLSLLRDTARWLHAHPVPDDIREQRRKFWARRAKVAKAPVAAAPTPADSARTVSHGAARRSGTTTVERTPPPSSPRHAAVANPPVARPTARRFAAAYPPLVTPTA